MHVDATQRMFDGRSPVVVSDWDETITVEDTTGILAGAAYVAKPFFTPEFLHFVNVYMQALCAYQQKYAHPRTDPGEERRYQEGLHAVEMTSINAIVQNGLFVGVPRAYFARGAEKVRFRVLAADFLRFCVCSNVHVVILSVNWSRFFIQLALELQGIDASKVEIIANDLEVKGEICTGDFDERFSVRTGLDKERYLKQIQKKGPVIYIGDSSSDLFALLASDLGVIIETGSVKELAQKLGIKVTKVGEWNGKSEGLLEGDWRQIWDLVRETEGEMLDEDKSGEVGECL